MGPVIPFLVVAVITLFVIAVFMAFRFKTRELQHRERMAALERGAALPPMADLIPKDPSWRPATMLLHGMMWLFSGAGLTVFLLAVSMTGPREVPASVRVEEANHAKGSGATDDQIRLIMNDKFQPGLAPGFSLIGLIPMGVGLSYLIVYRKEKSLKIAA